MGEQTKDKKKLESPKKKGDKKKTTKPPDANADNTGRTAGLAETVVRGQSEADLAAQQKANQLLSGVTEGPLTPVADPALGTGVALDQTPVGADPTQLAAPALGSTVPAPAPVEPLPEANLLQRLGSLANLFLPVIGNQLGKPAADIRERREKTKATDAVLVNKALELMDTNPDAAAVMMKNKDVMASFERHTGLDSDAIDSIAEMSKSLPMSMADTIKAAQADFGIDADTRKITDAPSGERERQGKIKDSLEQKAKAAGKDPSSVTELDVATWDASSQAGRDMYEMQATRKGIGLRNRVTNEVTDVTPESLEASNQELQPIKDADGFTIGYTLIDLDDGGVHQEIWFTHMIEDLRERIAAEMNLTPEQAATDPNVQEKAEKGWFDIIKNFFKGSVEEAAMLSSAKKGMTRSRQQSPVPADQGSRNPANDAFFN